MNTYGLYVNGKDIQRYVNDYLNYGIDYMGEDNVAAATIKKILFIKICRE